MTNRERYLCLYLLVILFVSGLSIYTKCDDIKCRSDGGIYMMIVSSSAITTVLVIIILEKCLNIHHY